MRVGTHVSIAGGIENAPGNAAKVGAEVFQIFSRSPHGGPVKPITPELVKKFQAEMKKHRQDTFYIHTPYFINLASTKNNIYFGSVSVIREELERGSKLGCRAVMTHLGSFGELSEKEGIKRVVSALAKIMDGYRGKTQLLLENSAGAGKLVGDTFNELASILYSKQVSKYDVGVCFDTCHAFATGYDVREKKSANQVLKQFDKTIGLKKLVMVHANDSKGEPGGHLDRHEHIGKGKIGISGFKAMVNHKALSKLDWVLETPKDHPKDDPQNINLLKKLRG
ncbi:MAG: deoxyribonuclease IV [Candidatus Doudnabacteria bacterium]|nr:deoxyribonuclease IV [Candidatus Doudnabacteria bacterium]